MILSSGGFRSSSAELIAHFHAANFSNNVHGDHLLVPAEIVSSTVEHPCQFWIGTRAFRLLIFGRRQHSTAGKNKI